MYLGASFTKVKKMRGKNKSAWRGKTLKPASVVSCVGSRKRGLWSEAGRMLVPVFLERSWESEAVVFWN